MKLLIEIEKFIFHSPLNVNYFLLVNPIETMTNHEVYIKTGVQGFDDMIDLGIPKGSQILVSGGPGTLKTTFCMQVLVNNASQGKRCLYLTFEEPEDNLLRNMGAYGWKLSELQKKGLLTVRNLDPFKMSRSVETLLAQARGELLIEVNEAKNLIPTDFIPDIIIVDSLSAISAGFFGREEGYRAYISQIFDTFRKMKATAFLITEIEHSTTKYSQSGIEEFLADGVFVFYNFRQSNERVNATEVIKLRGINHKKKIVPFKALPDKGIVVYPTEELFVK
jgi:KaiC/GvpD/RAD55 family RecA-like ATPase